MAERNLYRRGKIWHVKIERKGVIIHESTGETSLAKARKYRDHAITGLNKKRSGHVLFDDAMADFLEDCDIRLKPKTVERYETSAVALKPHLTGKYLHEIGKTEIDDIIHARSKEVKPATINRDRACLSAMFNFAVQGDKIETNPVDRTKKLREPQPRTRVLTDEEIADILPRLDQPMQDMTRFALETGLRESEIIMLKHSEVNVKKQELIVINSKSGKNRCVPLIDEALKVYASQIRHITSPYVFHHRDGQPFTHVSRSFKRAADAGKIKGAVFHDTRRTFATRQYQRLMKSGIRNALDVIRRLLGHSTYRVTETTYAFLTTEDLHEAMGTGTVAKTSQRHRTRRINKLPEGRKAKVKQSS